MQNENFQLYGKSLKMIRLTHGKKSKDTAKAVGLSDSYYCRCESGRKRLTPQRTKRFLEFVGISEDEAKQFVQIMNK